MSGFVKKLLAGSSKRAAQEEDQVVTQLQLVDSHTKKMSKELKKHCDALGNVAKTEFRVAEELFHVAVRKQTDMNSKNRSKGDVIAKRVPSIAKDAMVQMQAAERERELTVRLKLDEEKLLLEPLKKYCHLFPHVSSAVSRRESKRQDMEKAKAKVERYQERSLSKLEVAMVEARRAEEDFNKFDSQLSTEIPLLYNSRIQFLDICLGSLLMSEIAYYHQVVDSHAATLRMIGYPTVDNLEEEVEEKLSSLFEDMTKLSIISSPQSSA